MSDVGSVICPPGKAMFFVARKDDTQLIYWSDLLFSRINIVGSGNSSVCTKKKGPATVVTIQRPRDGGHQQQQQPQRSAVALKKKVNPAVQKAMKEDDETTSPESGNENGGRKRHPGGRYEH